jgi:hypothetical protein
LSSGRNGIDDVDVDVDMDVWWILWAETYSWLRSSMSNRDSDGIEAVRVVVTVIVERSTLDSRAGGMFEGDHA